MTGEPEAGTERVAARGRRGTRAVAASIVGVLVIGGYFAAAPATMAAPGAGYLLSAAVVALAFWFPAVRIGSAREVVVQWRSLVVWLLAWTLVWDLATSGVTGERALFEEWWIVYPSGVLILGGLLALHGAVVGRIGRAGADD